MATFAATERYSCLPVTRHDNTAGVEKATIYRREWRTAADVLAVTQTAAGSQRRKKIAGNRRAMDRRSGNGQSPSALLTKARSPRRSPRGASIQQIVGLPSSDVICWAINTAAPPPRLVCFAPSPPPASYGSKPSYACCLSTLPVNTRWLSEAQRPAVHQPNGTVHRIQQRTASITPQRLHVGCEPASRRPGRRSMSPC